MQLITIDVKDKTFSASAVEGSANSVEIYFDNTPEEWGEESLSVYALFSKGNNAVMQTVDKETMRASVPNSMVSENSGFKVTAFAMNSDTSNPYRYPLSPIWVQVSEGYACEVMDGPTKDNMDAFCTLIQAMQGYAEAEAARVEAENERKEAEMRRIELDGNRLGRYDPLDMDVDDLEQFENSESYIGTFAGVYTEYKGEDGNWRVRLYRANNGETEENRNVSRIPITRSDGTLLISEPGHDNGAVPRKYADLRYVKAFTTVPDYERTYVQLAGSGAASSRPVSRSIMDGVMSIPMRDKSSQNFHVGSPTQDTHVANRKFVLEAIADLVKSAPETLNTLDELAAALGDDPNFATTIMTLLGEKASKKDLKPVATSGSYNDLSDTPEIPSIDGLATEEYVNGKLSDINLELGILNDASAQHETVINNIKEDIQALDNSVAQLSEDLTATGSAVSENSERLDTIERKYVTSTSFSMVNATVQKHTTDINGLKEDVGDIETALDSIITMQNELMGVSE